jgi:GABA permease
MDTETVQTVQTRRADSAIVVQWTKNILVVANVTARSEELLAALRAQAARQHTTFTLIVPASGVGRAAAQERLEAALEHLRAAGLEVDGRVGAGDPIVAVSEAWDPKQHDEIIVSTLPIEVSKWLHAGLPARIGELTGAPVTHVVSRPREPIEAETARPHTKSTMGPLSVLVWGGRPPSPPRSG